MRPGGTLRGRDTPRHPTTIAAVDLDLKQWLRLEGGCGRGISIRPLWPMSGSEKI